jgi:SAM-dependent methyltransferase
MIRLMHVTLTLEGTPRWDELAAELTSTLTRLGVAATVEPDGRITLPGGEGELKLARTADGVALDLGGLAVLDEENEAGWIAEWVVVPLIQALQKETADHWIIDRWARRPSGSAARASYRDPTHHRPSFGAVLEALQLQPDDVLLEIGCGGGVFLQQAVDTVSRAAGIDHSLEMIEVARDLNTEAVAAGRLTLVQGEAEELPFTDDEFTCAAMMQVFFFLDAPVVLAECRRVLRQDGRIAVYTISEAGRGTPAAPEPFASYARFYTDDELIQLASEAGFPDASVTHPELLSHARAAGLPDDVVALFAEGQEAGQLLLARG